MKIFSSKYRSGLGITFLLLGFSACTDPKLKADAAFESKDYLSALPLYERSAARGNRDAQNRLGQIYEQGLGLPRNYDKSEEWYRRAAESGSTDAQMNLGFLLIRHSGTQLKGSGAQLYSWFRTAAEQGNPRGQAGLGYLYKIGILGAGRIDKDIPQAIAWLDKAADQGDVFAHLQLADLYYRGTETSQNYAEAVDHYEAAARQNDGLAMYMLGLMHNMGEGVPFNKIEAYRWYKSAQDHGYDVRNSLGDLKTILMKPEEVREAETSGPTLPVVRKSG
jgi:TPR repeat protein